MKNGLCRHDRDSLVIQPLPKQNVTVQLGGLHFGFHLQVVDLQVVLC